MAYHEVGLDDSFESLQKFAMNILQQHARIAPGSSEEIDIQVRYLQTQMQVLLTRKIDVALNGLSAAVDRASVTSTINAENALAEARQMRFATWGLVAGTFVLAFATGFLVWYTHELVLAEREAATVSQPATTGVGNGPNP